MGWTPRLGLLCAGLYAIFLARAELHGGHIAFGNALYHQATFTAAGFGTGLLLIALACLPPSEWMYKRITTKPRPADTKESSLRR